jgi:drug/metabolite transporter (DMT)-like permease
VYAVKTTSAANAAFLGSTAPLFGVVVARVFLGERISIRTYVAIAVAFAGLVVMVVGDLQAGDFADNVVGNLAALGSAAGFAFYAAIVRSAPERDWSPVLPGYGVMMIAICATITLADGKTLVPPAADISLAIVHGAVFIVGGTLIFNVASRHVPAAAMTLFAQTELVLLPIWAFLLLSETPTASTLLGGSIIVVAVVSMAVLDTRQHAPTEVLTAA